MFFLFCWVCKHPASLKQLMVQHVGKVVVVGVRDMGSCSHKATDEFTR